ncbi:hypothetical protein KY285_025454 [Solanum tuberosum]|nr:hypothetical protein KY285_025454 [Solanum tuberosum]
MGDLEEHIDHKHPFFLQPSDTPGKFGFVNGTCSREKFQDTLADAWEKCDVIVHSWIMNSVLKHLLSGIVYGSSASAVWEDLKERFNKINRILMKSIAPTVVTGQDRLHDPTILQAGRDPGYKGKRSILRCEHYHVRGHTKEQCWKIIGYPDDFKPRGRYNSGGGSGNQNANNQLHPQNQLFVNGKYNTQPFAHVNNAYGVGTPAGTSIQDSHFTGGKASGDEKGQYFTETQDAQFRETTFPFRNKIFAVTQENHMLVEHELVQFSPLTTFPNDHVRVEPAEPIESSGAVIPEAQDVAIHGIASQELVADNTQDTDVMTVEHVFVVDDTHDNAMIEAQA